MALKYRLELRPVVREDGRYAETAGPELRGLHALETGEALLRLLEARGALLGAKPETAEYNQPSCGRCRHPVIYR